MRSTREAFLGRVREALRAGNRPGLGADVEARGNIGYQGAGADPATQFCNQFVAAGGQVYRLDDRESAVAKVVELAGITNPRRILLGSGAVIDSLGLLERLQVLGGQVTALDSLPEEECRDAFFGADLGISGVDYLVAETGTVVSLARPNEPRSLSLLPPVHIAVASLDQLVPDLFDLFDSAMLKTDGSLPSCVSLITGPSKTGDIELKLVTGVHGPGEIHVVLLGR